MLQIPLVPPLNCSTIIKTDGQPLGQDFPKFFTLEHRKYNNIFMVSGYFGRDLEKSIWCLAKKKIITFLFFVLISSKKKKTKYWGKH